MFINDDELRDIFKATSEEHLQQMEANVLHLEKHPADSATLENLLREIHSLKGDANMLGIKDIGTLAHQFEDILGAVKRGETAYSIELSDRLYQGLDAMGQLVHAAVTGQTAETNVIHVMAYLMGAPKEPEQAVEHGNNGKVILLEPVPLVTLSTGEDERDINERDTELRDTETWQHRDLEPFRHLTPSLLHAPKTSLPTSAHR
ncbi:MAG TPA: Hpt domain-containing protein, partial [Crinalium sp.]